jgi:hypothetical protein
MYPEEIINEILSYCPGHIRADLRRKNISVKLQNNIIDIGRLHEISTSDVTFLEQYHTDNHPGYICKSIKHSDGFIRYSWIIIRR